MHKYFKSLQHYDAATSIITFYIETEKVRNVHKITQLGSSQMNFSSSRGASETLP